jgi:hypothetical protein
MPPKKQASKAPRAALESIPPNTGLKRPLTNSSEDALPKPKRPTRATTSKPNTTATIETPPNWAFNITGTWTINTKNLLKDLPWLKREYGDNPPPFTMEIKYANNPSHKKIGRQLWATFKWEKYTGCIRFCPGHKYSTNHVQFEEGCVLKPGVWAGASPRGIQVWNFRWRAEYEGEGVVEGSDQHETQIEFGEDGDGSLKVAGRIVFGGYKARKFEGVRTGELEGKGNEKGVGGWWKSLTDPYAESKYMLCYRIPTDSDNEDDGSSDEPEIDWEQIRKDREEAERKEKEEEKQPWPTEMTGEWKIIPRQKFTMDDEDPAAPRWMKIHYEAEAGRRQYYAEFQFGNDWSGIMRFCPKQIDLVKKGMIDVEEFEEACILKVGVAAGPPPKGVNQWLIKWRGIFDEPGISNTVRRETGPKDEMTTSITFKRGGEGKLVLSGVLVGGCLVVPYTGVRIGETPPRGPNDPSIEELWDQKKYIPPPPPPVPKLWPWISPLPNPTIEAPPAWAWDVLGKWKIDAPEVAVALKIGSDAPLTMTIHMSNHAKQKKIGRQLWATFQFGPNLSGCMRFCPLPENSRPADTCAIFEKQCVLKKGIWPGHVNSAKGKSFQKWGHRWRARNSETGDEHGCSDTVEHMLEFRRDDGTLKLGGVFGAIWMLCSWSAVKIEDAVQANVSDADVEKVWKSYSSR